MHKLILQAHRKYSLILIVGDLLLTMGSLSIVLLLEPGRQEPPAWSLAKILAIYFTVPAVTVVVFYVLDLYDPTSPKGSEITFFTICIGLGAVTIVYSALAYFLISLRPGKINLLLFISITAAFTFMWRRTFKKLVPIKPQRLLFIGNDPIFEEISLLINEQYAQHYDLVEQWDRHNHQASRPNLYDYLEKNHVELVVYSLRSGLVKEIADDLITANFRKKSIIDAYNFYQELTYKCPLHFLDDFSLLLNANKEIFMPAVVGNLKRALDLTGVLLLAPFVLPAFLIVALAVKLDSTGPVLFIQERLGKNEVPFRLYKLRTMIHNAEGLTGPKWSTEDDPRITRIGKILRKLRLDELPQLYNVLRGDMTVVGPRPIRRHFADILAGEIPYYRLRFLIKPGLTGWAQVNHDYAGSNAGQADKQQYDLFYLIHQSFLLDLFILFKTVKVMVWGKGT
ncbi:exopolysaccharide biosynthesis polyprenyl glycosylphosphotransferase [Syntrophobacter fumaroxidans]|uniref:Sugar transferase n=1 Tax=Syntrophobacter fumaroxidans (strain DSM 10017 / MPOB) TaxID=335543 RepID=A0LKB9_SYNFM|nr:exopolysaccharide biosynthesis polyprenyl glycosylphosphotransferase [Syntrophobacter fumaroxidans]ABK17871.1 sugar transferase [Syntrophobacter fumaroxidans MPOB]